MTSKQGQAVQLVIGEVVQGYPLRDILLEIEKLVIVEALLVHGCNRNRASKFLRMERTTLVEKMRRHKLLEQYPSPSGRRLPEKLDRAP